MRDFDTNPTSYECYTNGYLYDGERVYCFNFSSVDEAYAIREDGEDYDDFVGEVEWHLRRKYGRRVAIRYSYEVTGTFE